MFKLIRRSKRAVIIICLVLFAVLLSVTFLVIQNNKSKDISNLYSANLDDFNFKLNFNTYGKDQIDTYKGTFTKDLVIDGTKTIDFKIPDSVKKDIYKMMMDIDIMSFPNSLKVEGMSVTPSFDYKLTVTINGKTKTIVWNEGFYTDMNTNLPKDNVNFLKLVKHISDYIHSTEEYKNMPQANGGYD
ncbi:MAG: hypothetical protein Q8942_00550 [Bacillota bacterium]|nr:hypothetical protein [Bacillota bacterium]